MASEGVMATLRAGWAALASVDAPKGLIGGLALTAWNGLFLAAVTRSWSCDLMT